MAEHLSTQDIKDIAQYARIGLTPDEVATMQHDLNEIIDSFQPILDMDLEGVEPTFHPIGSLSNVMRADVPTTSFSQTESLVNAPQQQDGSFLIPSILGTEE